MWATPAPCSSTKSSVSAEGTSLRNERIRIATAFEFSEPIANPGLLELKFRLVSVRRRDFSIGSSPTSQTPAESADTPPVHSPAPPPAHRLPGADPVRLHACPPRVR